MLRQWARLQDEAGDGTGGSPSIATPGPDDWKSSIPEDLRNTTLVQETKSIGDLAKQAIDAQKMVGNSLRIPSDNAGPEDRAKFREKLRTHVPNLVELDREDPTSLRALQRSIGLPEEAEGYVQPTIDVPSGLSIDMGAAEAFRPIAHKHGLSQEQYAGVIKDMSAGNVEVARKSLVHQQEQQELLKDDWGNAFDQKTKQALAAARATNAPEALIKAVEDGKAGAATMRWLAKVHDSLGKQTLGAVDSGGAPGSEAELTPGEATRQKIEIMNNKDHPYWHRDDPNHTWAVNEFRRLTQAAIGKGHNENALMATVGNDDGRPVINFEGTV